MEDEGGIGVRGPWTTERAVAENAGAADEDAVPAEAEAEAEQSDGYGLTTTLNYRLSENVFSRAEWRWDHTEARVNGDHDTQSWSLSLIYEF